MINAEQAIEKGLDVIRKAGYFYVVASEAFQEGGYWIVIVEALVRRFRVKIDMGGNVVEVRELKESKMVS